MFACIYEDTIISLYVYMHIHMYEYIQTCINVYLLDNVHL